MATYYAIIAKIDAKGRAVATCPGSHCKAARVVYDGSKNALERCTEAAQKLAEDNNLGGYYVAASLKNGDYVFARIMAYGNLPELRAMTNFYVAPSEKYHGPKVDISDAYNPKNYATHLMLLTLENDAETMRDIERIIEESAQFKTRANDQYLSNIAARISRYVEVSRSRGVIAITRKQIENESDLDSVDYMAIAENMVTE